MDKGRAREIFRKGFNIYIIYVFIFAVLIFAVQKPKENIEDLLNHNGSIETLNKDRVALVESGEDGGLVRLNLIQNAQESLYISYYTLTAGDSTKLMLGSILDAADRGVEVRILLDGIFHNLKRDLRDTIYGFDLHPNIELKFYQPLNLLKPLSWNNRLHDKIIIVDDNLALIGGRNIGDKYFREDLMKDNFVKDRDVVIFKEDFLEGSSSVITDMKKYIHIIWNHEYSQPSIKKSSAKQHLKGERYNENLRIGYKKFKEVYWQKLQYTDWQEKTIATDNIRFVHNPIGRSNEDPWCLRELLIMASEAEESIFIQSPYIIPTRNMKAKFSLYPIDYEKITMLTNSLYSSPNPLAIAGYLNSKKEIVDSGVDIYEYQGPKSIHSKTYIIDNYMSVIGSFNFDARSTYINTESMVIISSEDFAEKLKENIELDLDNSLKVDKDYEYIYNEKVEERKVSTFKKALMKILSKVVLFLDYLL